MFEGCVRGGGGEFGEEGLLVRIHACVVCPQVHTRVIFVIHSYSDATLSTTLPPVCQPKSKV